MDSAQREAGSRGEVWTQAATVLAWWSLDSMPPNVSTHQALPTREAPWPEILPGLR